MATSGSVDFAVTRNEIVSDAYSHVGHLDEGETLGGERLAYGVRQLNKMMKAWVAQGYHLWTLKEGVLPLSQGTSSYTIGPTGDYVINRPNRIVNARRKDADDLETPCWLISRDEYFTQPNKSSEGKVVQVYYDRQLTNGVMYVWPAPDNSTDTIAFSYEGTIEDFDSNSDDTPFPQEWSEALSWNLAVRLGARENVDMQTLSFVKSMANETLSLALSFDSEDVSLYFQPDMR